ncbi:MAG: SRPBCC domain-containing protein [Proteobacteria bacterium]|nr:SRPBCC domain-containing protein [Pseudomonadota bacterium]
MRSLFPSAQARDFVLRTYGALEGGRQTLARLGEQLAAAAVDDAPFVLTRVFKAPRALVWDAWTQSAHLARWMGPAGTRIVKATLDLRPGGTYHYGMEGPGGQVMWGKWVFREIVAGERLVCIVSFSDADGGITRHPGAAQWPLETQSTVTFADHAGIGRGTTVVLEWAPYRASAEERAVFAASHAGMTQGWGGTMAQLEAYLAQLVAGPGG